VSPFVKFLSLFKPPVAPRGDFTAKVQGPTVCGEKQSGSGLLQFLANMPGPHWLQHLEEAGLCETQMSIAFVDLDTWCISVEIQCQSKPGPPFELIPTKSWIIIPAVFSPFGFVRGRFVLGPFVPLRDALYTL